jgi:hypothetical protein
MLRRLIEILDRHARGRTVLAAFVASVAFGWAPLTWAVHRIRAHSPDAAPLDMASSYTPDEAYAMIARYGADVRSFYIWNAFTLDVLGPLLFNLTFVLAALTLMRSALGPASRFRVVVVAAALTCFTADLTENVLLSIVVARFPARADAVAQAACVATLVKRFASVVGVMMLVGLAPAAVRTLLGRRPVATAPRH